MGQRCSHPAPPILGLEGVLARFVGHQLNGTQALNTCWEAAIGSAPSLHSKARTLTCVSLRGLGEDFIQLKSLQSAVQTLSYMIVGGL